MNAWYWFFLGLFTGGAIECALSLRFFRRLKTQQDELNEIAKRLEKELSHWLNIEKTLDDKLKDEQSHYPPKFRIVDKLYLD